MSLVTTCPACATSFLIKPEHLAAHRGDVRCGQCDFVFNALDKLGESVQATPTEDLIPEVIETTPEIVAEPVAETVLETTESVIEPEPEPEISWPEIIQPHTELEPPVEAAELSPVVTDSAVATTTDDDPFSAASFDEIAETPIDETGSTQTGDAFDQTDFSDLQVPIPEITKSAAPHADLTDYKIEPAITSAVSPASDSVIEETAPYEPSSTFIERIYNAEEQTPEKRGRRKWLSILLAVILVIAGLAQTTYFLRTPISITLPTLKPSLVQACVKLRCTVELPKNIKLLVIDDSSIQEDTEHADVIRLSSTLINNAEFPQAYPMLELTLTDANDAPSLRRTFKPSEYLPPSTKISDGIPAGEELHINLALTTNGEKVSGYRVQVNY